MELTMQQTETILLLKYFSLFRHPLTLDEIYKFSSEEMTKETLQLQLNELEQQGAVQFINGLYVYMGDEGHVTKRLNGEANAALLIPKAKRAGKLISHFPFVKFVGISGSLSKNYADEKTDFDFFIITANNTLWICRTLLHLFKKMSFLVGKQHSFCMNYFIDENHLEIEECNIFTRIELSTLIPLNNQPIYQLLLSQNRKNLPNLCHLLPGITKFKNAPEAVITHFQEKNQWLKSINLFFMKMTDKKWKSKWNKRGYPLEDYPLAFKTTPFVSKNHPKNYQKNILNQLQKEQH